MKYHGSTLLEAVARNARGSRMIRDSCTLSIDYHIMANFYIVYLFNLPQHQIRVPKCHKSLTITSKTSSRYSIVNGDDVLRVFCKLRDLRTFPAPRTYRTAFFRSVAQ